MQSSEAPGRFLFTAFSIKSLRGKRKNLGQKAVHLLGFLASKLSFHFPRKCSHDQRNMIGISKYVLVSRDIKDQLYED